MKYRECYDKGQHQLKEAGIGEYSLDARLLLEYVCNTDRNALLVHGNREVEEESVERYLELIAKRAAHIPLQHLTGIQNFMGLDFAVNEHVLIPRQDTEILVEEVMRQLHDGMQILDMCTGSGCILISLLHYSNACVGVGVDISQQALEVAEENAKNLLGQGQMPGRLSLLCSNLFEKVDGSFDMIVSNPPYIRTDIIDSLAPEVKEHEPRQALDGLGDGLYFYRQIITESRAYLKRGGMLFFEIGYDQADEVNSLMQAAGFVETEVVKDYAGLNRVVYGTYIG